MNADDIKQAMNGVRAWNLAADGRSISRTFKFPDFIAAFGFMTRSALIAEKLDHHPDWSNVYRTVAITLTTHDAKGLTELDFSLAAAMDRLAA
jgi:4a-hydroxytetrahydrobiopterin dehydratase